MKLHCLFKHYGSKWSGAKHYPPPLPGLPIFEPDAGSAGYSLNYADHQVVLWEEDPHLYHLWKFLISADTKMCHILDIPVNLPVGMNIQDPALGLDSGQRLLLKHWQRTNNVGDCWTISKWGNLPGQWTANTRARVANEMLAIKHWKLERVCYRLPGTYFFDPPYEFNYKYRFIDPYDYDQLAYNISLIPAGSRAIVCEATCSKTGRVPSYLPFAPSHRQVTSRRKATNNHHSQELVWTEDR